MSSDGIVPLPLPIESTVDKSTEGVDKSSIVKNELIVAAPSKQQELSQQSNASETVLDASQDQAMCTCSPRTRSRLSDNQCKIHPFEEQKVIGKKTLGGHHKSQAGTEGVKFQQFVTCTYPEKLSGKVGERRPKYEIKVIYKDTNKNAHQKRFKIGSYRQADLRDENLTAEEKTKAIQKAAKFGKYLVNRDSFDKDLCVSEQWPTQKDFWAANYLWNSKAVDPVAVGDYTATQLEDVIVPLRQIGRD